MRLRESAATNGSTTALGTTANNTTATAATVGGDALIPEQDEVKVHHEVTLYLGDIQDHILTMLQNVNHYDLILGRAHRNYLGQISIELSQAGNTTNEVINRLTFFATVIVPLVSALYIAWYECSPHTCVESGWRFIRYERPCARSKQRRSGVVLLDRAGHVAVCCSHGGYWQENRLPLDFIYLPISSIAFDFALIKLWPLYFYNSIFCLQQQRLIYARNQEQGMFSQSPTSANTMPNCHSIQFLFSFCQLPINHWLIMSTSSDLYSKFAKVVDGFGPDSAKETADHFADLTCLHEK